MKHIKNFTNYRINEEFEVGNLLGNIKSKISSWKDGKKKEAAKFFIKAMEEQKDNPELQSAIANLKLAYKKLKPEDLLRIKSLADERNIPNVPGEDARALESMVTESVNIREVAGRLIKFIGTGSASISFIGLVITIIKIMVEGSAAPPSLFSLSLGTLGAILMGILVSSSALFGIGTSLDPDEVKQ